MALYSAQQHFSLHSEFLATWTKMSTPLRKDDTFDERPTAETRLPILLIDFHMVVVIAGFAPEITVTTKGRASMLNGKGQYQNNA